MLEYLMIIKYQCLLYDFKTLKKYIKKNSSHCPVMGNNSSFILIGAILTLGGFSCTNPGM